MKQYLLYGFFEYIGEKFNGSVPNLIFFGIGIFLGVVLFAIFFLIAYLVSKNSKANSSKKNKNNIVIREEYKTIIKVKTDIFNLKYKELNDKEKLNGVYSLIYSMIEEIASLYYPNSKNPILEVSIERLVDFLDLLVHRIDFISDQIIDNKLKLADKFISFSKKNKIKDLKLSLVLNYIKKKNNNKEIIEKKPNFFRKIKKKLTSIVKKGLKDKTNNMLNYTFNTFFDDIGEDINKLYSGQDLSFKSNDILDSRAGDLNV